MTQNICPPRRRWPFENLPAATFVTAASPFLPIVGAVCLVALIGALFVWAIRNSSSRRSPPGASWERGYQLVVFTAPKLRDIR